jgi:hypothetical protein
VFHPRYSPALTLVRAAGSVGVTRRTAALAVFLLLAILPLRAQSLEGVLSRSRYSPQVQAEISGEFREAEKQGIPLELLLPRLEEGIAKKVSSGRLLAALQREQDLLLQARGLLLGLDGGSRLLEDQASWARAANLLAGGYSAGEVAELARSSLSRAEDFRPATSLYVSLRGWGLASGQALELVRGLLASSISGERFPGIMEILIEGRRLRIAPETLVRRLLEQLPEARTIEELRQRCLQP